MAGDGGFDWWDVSIGYKLRSARSSYRTQPCMTMGIMILYRGSLRIAKEAAERTNAEKAWLLAVASHDLRQPLQALRLFAAALQCQTKAEPQCIASYGQSHQHFEQNPGRSGESPVRRCPDRHGSDCPSCNICEDAITV
ncbi:MAG: hypothetical protein FD153_1305 [Rhodospirillaceae bacterium]|nr:MAG: hypothetical protein FD153_1305 [Rhodospirillaceae bacterium]